jgi:glycine cleavage system transcriptional repressor
MRTNIIFTLTGADRVGIVEEVTQLLLDLGGNVETSRMARLGGAFAILMLVSLPSEQLLHLDKHIDKLVAEGYKVTTSQTEQTSAETHAGWLAYQIEVCGADHEGIVHEVAHYLSQQGINIESMDTEIRRAPISGAPLFAMSALVAVPPSLSGQVWQAALEEVGQHLNVDINIFSAPGEAMARPGRTGEGA